MHDIKSLCQQTRICSVHNILLSDKFIPIFPSLSPEIVSRRQINNLPSHKSVNKSSTWLLFCKNKKNIAGHNITGHWPNSGFDLLPGHQLIFGKVFHSSWDLALHSCSVSFYSGVLMVAQKLSRQCDKNTVVEDSVQRMTCLFVRS